MKSKKVGKLGKAVALIVALLMVVSLAVPAFAQDTKTASGPVVSMTEPKEVVFEARMSADTKVSDLKWYFGDKELSAWKKWSMETGDFTAGPFITFTKEPVIENGLLKATISFDRLFDTTDLSQRRPYNIRLKYPEFIGTYELKAVNEAGQQQAKLDVSLVPYESYMSYDQMKAAVADIKNSAKADRFVNLEVYGTTVQGRPMDLGIIAKDKEAVDKYLNETTPMMLENPEKMIADIKANKADYKTVIFMNNIHPDEQPGVDAVVKLFNDYAKEDFIDYATTDENGKKVNKRINVDNLLEDFILVFSFTQNPDGRVANTRANANNLDLNRDNGFQTQPETQAMAAQISKYNPLIFLDYHGFVQEFLIEPCTPPHDPNYETDLLYSTMLELAHIMGRAGVENSKYEDYLIPMIDYGTGWDDATSAYTATYAMHHGALGHTIEVPEMNEDSFKAAIHTGYAAADYAINNKDMLMLNKLEYYKRGVEKLDSREADKAIVNAQNEIKGRPRGNNESFFPDYYVIPMGLDAQKNAVAAFDMVAYLERNGVKVHELKSDAGAYKKGDIVVDMAQAKRGYANQVLYSGVDESEWAEMYAEIVTNFPAQRGFDVMEVRDANLFTGKLGDVTISKAPSSSITDAKFYLIHNNSLETVKAVNHAIEMGHKVVRADLGQGKEGFAVDKACLEMLVDKHALKFEALDKMPEGKEITSKTVYAPAMSTAYFALEAMGFEVVTDASKADVLVTDSGSLDPELIGSKPMVAIGGSAMAAIGESGKIAGLEVKTTDFYHEGLLKSTNNASSMYSLGYASDDTMYSSSGTWIEKLPAGFTALSTVKNTGDYFVAGWWPGHEQVKGKVMSAVGMVNGQKTVLYAGNLTNRLHTQYLYRWISNAVYELQ